MRIATLNLRNTADRWRERRSLLVRQLVDLAPDVAGLQEVRTVPNQARWIAGEAERQSGGRLRYRCYGRRKVGLWGAWEGIAILTAVPVTATAWIALGSQARVAQRVTVRPPHGGLLDLYNTHLGVGGEALRTAQARLILDWMAARPPVPTVLLGDLNARPESPTIQLLSSRLRSAHGDERPPTVPTPLRPGRSGDASILDYVLVNDLVEVRDATRAFAEADPTDPTLYPSDHYGLAVTVGPV